jgi:hypothetical protein
LTALEDATLSVAAGIKAVNPKATAGMYWRTGLCLEIAEWSRSSGTKELKSHGTDWFIRDDNGTLVGSPGHYSLDYSNKRLPVISSHGFFSTP